MSPSAGGPGLTIECMQPVTRRSLGRGHGTGHLLAGLLAGDGVHEEILEEHLQITGGGSATLVVVVALDVDGGSHRSERITEGSSLAVGLGDAVALRLGCQDDELQVGDVVGDVGHDWSPGVSGVIEL